MAYCNNGQLMMQKDSYYLAIRNYGEGRKERMVRETGRKKR